MSEFIPNEGQREALRSRLPTLVLAGAGTGKTTVLTHRIAGLVADGRARPEEILALTFADKAAAEMSERLGSVLAAAGMGDAGREVHCSTFHSFGAEIIRDYAPLLGMESDCRVLTTAECWQLLYPIVDEMDFDSIELPMGGPGAVVGRLLALFSRAQDHLVTPEQLAAFVEAGMESGAEGVVADYWRTRLAPLGEAAEVYRRYQEAKRARGYLDYGDLLMLPVQLLQSHKVVRRSYRARFRYLFVDEYQDTNHAQRRLLMELLPPGAPVFVIGDDDQSIYGWRGAVLSNILRFDSEPQIREAGLTLVKLSENRRSGPAVLEVANRVVGRIDKPEAYRKRLEPLVGGTITATVGHFVAASGESEAAWIARTIEELHGTPAVEDPTGKKRGYGVFAVLCRKRSLFPSIAAALDAAGIPYELIGGTGFFGRWEIRDVISYLRVLADPANNVALARVLASRPWRISDADQFHLSAWARSEARQQAAGRANAGEPEGGGPAPGDGAEAIEGLETRLIDAVAAHEVVPGLGEEARARLGRLRELLDGLARAEALLPLPDLVELVIEWAGYRRELSVRAGRGGDVDCELALLNLGKLVELARQFQGREGGLPAFVEYVQFALESGGEEQEVRPVDEASDAVKVMTIHQAKGLEFPVVFLPGLAERIFPDVKVDNPDGWDQLPEDLRGDAEEYPRLDLEGVESEAELEARLKARRDLHERRELEEERRLLYVAVTRAQRALCLSRAHWYFSNVRPRKPSRFWAELIDGDDGAAPCSTLVGEEPDPGFNPSAREDASAGPERERASGLARLLLDPDRLAGWVANMVEGEPAWERRRAEVDAQLAALARTPIFVTLPAPVSVSCSALIRYDECPRVYRYLHVDGLPSRPMPWARLGSEVHRRIEEQTLLGEGWVRAPDAETREPDPDEEESLRGEPVQPGVQALLRAYRKSRFARRPAARVEESFSLPVGGSLLRGRIDRLDRLADGRWELVDFKAGRYRGLTRRQRLQMQLYSLAAWRLWGVGPGSLSCHILFLMDGHEAVMHHSAEELAAVEAWALEQLGRIGRREYPRAASPEVCGRCDYARICALEA